MPGKSAAERPESPRPGPADGVGAVGCRRDLLGCDRLASVVTVACADQADPQAEFRAFLAGLIDNPMQAGQPFSVLAEHIAKTLGLTMTCAVLEQPLYFRNP